MNNSEYYRYRNELITRNVVTFPSRSKLIEFVSSTVCRSFEEYIDFCMIATPDRNEKKNLADRKEHEISMIDIYATTYLETHVVNENNPIYNFMKGVFQKIPERYWVKIDVNHEGLYSFVLDRLNHGDTPKEVFSNDVRYIIEGHRRLRRKRF